MARTGSAYNLHMQRVNLGRYDVGRRLWKLQRRLGIRLPLGESLNPSALEYDFPRILHFWELSYFYFPS